MVKTATQKKNKPNDQNKTFGDKMTPFIESAKEISKIAGALTGIILVFGGQELTHISSDAFSIAKVLIVIIGISIAMSIAYLIARADIGKVSITLDKYKKYSPAIVSLIVGILFLLYIPEEFELINWANILQASIVGGFAGGILFGVFGNKAVSFFSKDHIGIIDNIKSKLFRYKLHIFIASTSVTSIIILMFTEVSDIIWSKISDPSSWMKALTSQLEQVWATTLETFSSNDYVKTFWVLVKYGISWIIVLGAIGGMIWGAYTVLNKIFYGTGTKSNNSKDTKKIKLAKSSKSKSAKK